MPARRAAGRELGGRVRELVLADGRFELDGGRALGVAQERAPEGAEGVVVTWVGSTTEFGAPK